MNECLDPRDGERCGICPVDLVLQQAFLAAQAARAAHDMHGSPSDLDFP